ncbi:hypothetical protein [Nocardioides zeae]|uniref:hypothetical protein n=1 Tax=Nocardioides zeae TaxID=1457234 RepID=UPI0027D92618|nr:hypothetical protein [Nocardioides zeae]
MTCDDADLIYDRAAAAIGAVDDEMPSPWWLEGDRALCTVLTFHGLVDNGGLLNAIQSHLEDDRVPLDLVIARFRFLEMPHVAAVLQDARDSHGALEPDEHDAFERLEATVDSAYQRVLDGDSTLMGHLARFAAARPDLFADPPADPRPDPDGRRGEVHWVDSADEALGLPMAGADEGITVRDTELTLHRFEAARRILAAMDGWGDGTRFAVTESWADRVLHLWHPDPPAVADLVTRADETFGISVRVHRTSHDVHALIEIAEQRGLWSVPGTIGGTVRLDSSGLVVTIGSDHADPGDVVESIARLGLAVPVWVYVDDLGG